MRNKDDNRSASQSQQQSTSSRSDADVRSADSLGSESEIARRAYRRFEERGYEHGRDVDDWLEAEREVRQTGQ
jgi:hypothetical protein